MSTSPQDDLVLHQIDGPSVPSSAVPAGGTTTLGRGAGCRPKLLHASVSREHARIESRDACWRLRDLGGEWGTFVNSVRVDAEEPVVLRANDEVRIGPWAFLVRHSGERVDTEFEGTAPEEERAPSAVDIAGTRASYFVRMQDDRTEVRELSWEQFVARYGPVIVGVCRRLGCSSDFAEDIRQEVLLSFFRRLPNFTYDPSKGRFRGFLRVATVNAIRMQLRRRRPDAPLPDEVASDDSERTHCVWDTEWNRMTLDRAFVECRPRFQDRVWKAFELYGVRGVPAAEAGADLGMSAESVRKAKSNVARAVREIVERIRGEEG